MKQRELYVCMHAVREFIPLLLLLLLLRLPLVSVTGMCRVASSLQEDQQVQDPCHRKEQASVCEETGDTTQATTTIKQHRTSDEGVRHLLLRRHIHHTHARPHASPRLIVFVCFCFPGPHSPPESYARRMDSSMWELVQVEVGEAYVELVEA